MQLSNREFPQEILGELAHELDSSRDESHEFNTIFVHRLAALFEGSQPFS
jgi:hypothetical protein